MAVFRPNFHRVFIPGSTTNLGESELDSPDLTLVAESVFTDELQFLIPKDIISDMNRDKLLNSGPLTNEHSRMLSSVSIRSCAKFGHFAVRRIASCRRSSRRWSFQFVVVYY